MTDYPDWAGTPLVTADVAVLNLNSVAVAQGQTVTFTAPVIRNGYNIRFEVWNATDNVTAIPVNVKMRWFDTATGFQVNRQEWSMYAGTFANSHIIRGHGPTEGDQLNMQVTNNSAGAVTLNFSAFIVEATRTFTVHDWRTDVTAGYVIPGFNNLAVGSMFANTLAMFVSVGIGASATQTWLLPLYSGPAGIIPATTGGNASLEVDVLTSSDPNIAVGGFHAISFNATNPTPQQRIVLPRAQCVAQIVNHDAVPRNFWLGITCDNF